MDAIALYTSGEESGCESQCDSAEDFDGDLDVWYENGGDGDEFEEDVAIVSEVSEAKKSKSKITDFFQKVPDPSKPSEFPSCLRSFRPTDVHRSRPRARSVGRPRRVSSEAVKTKKKRCAYRSYSLRWKL